MKTLFVVTPSDVISLIVISVFVVIILIILSCNFVTFIKQKLCKHNSGVYETRACEAICLKCRKNLGFIGNLEKVRNENE
jgi:hypothetical protein